MHACGSPTALEVQGTSQLAHIEPTSLSPEYNTGEELATTRDVGIRPKRRDRLTCIQHPCCIRMHYACMLHVVHSRAFTYTYQMRRVKNVRKCNVMLRVNNAVRGTLLLPPLHAFECTNFRMQTSYNASECRGARECIAMHRY